ncbi:MAG: DUF2491 family protein [Rudaea sp.]|uniref:DUF2491 family protein n=1 Tax=unclassified Rudaea TaxID=2627037 RepID=UPI0010F67F2B|nr:MULTISPECIES: DUF2491 family protein [unclassified Rudaea]MBN8885591.1 DUF2491 family protein [Rudaea sp.]MBR0344074.1 DUF2491 family protein [Rudaea sp.]
MDWFGNKQNGAKPGTTLPYGARLRGAVSFDDLLAKLGADAFNFDWPSSPQTIEAIGDIDLGAGSRLYRLYLTDDAFLQIATVDGAPGDVNLFVYAESINPSSKDAFERWVTSGRLPDYTLGERSYTRVWGEGEGMAQPVPLEERIYKKDLDTPEYDLTLYSMLYSRELPGMQRNELLLVAGEDSGPEDFVISQAVGIALSTAEFEIT